MGPLLIQFVLYLLLFPARARDLYNTTTAADPWPNSLPKGNVSPDIRALNIYPYRTASLFNVSRDWLITGFTAFANTAAATTSSSGVIGLNYRIWLDNPSKGSVVSGDGKANVLGNTYWTGWYSWKAPTFTTDFPIWALQATIPECYAKAGTYYLELGAVSPTPSCFLCSAPNVFWHVYYRSPRTLWFKSTGSWYLYEEGLGAAFVITGDYPISNAFNSLGRTSVTLSYGWNLEDSIARNPGTTIYCVTNPSGLSVPANGNAVIEAAKASRSKASVIIPWTGGLQNITMTLLDQYTSYTTYCAASNDGTNALTIEGGGKYVSATHSTLAVACPSLTNPNGALQCTSGVNGSNTYLASCNYFCDDNYRISTVTITQSGNCQTSWFSSSTIQVGGSPSYAENQTCVWTFQSVDQVVLKFSSFLLQYDASCSADYLSIYDGGSQSSSLVGKYCGGNGPSTVISSGSALTVAFVSNIDGIFATGFTFTFTNSPRSCRNDSTWSGVVPLCESVDPCLSNNGGCDPLTSCTYTDVVTCGACPVGYTGTGKTGCVDQNECLVDNGNCSNGCINQPGSYFCGPVIEPNSLDALSGGTLYDGSYINLTSNDPGANILQFYVQAGGDPEKRLTNFGTLNDISVTFARIGQVSSLAYSCAQLTGTNALTQAGVEYGSRVLISCELPTAVGNNLYFTLGYCYGTQCFQLRDSSRYFNFPRPVITSGTLRTISMLNGVTSLEFTSNVAMLLVFEGYYFVNDPLRFSVFYGDTTSPLQYPCTLDASTTTTQVVCQTFAGASGKNMSFTVIANDQSTTGTDKLSYPDVGTIPVIESISGCEPDGNGTKNCPTEGQREITVTGQNFEVGASVSIVGTTCSPTSQTPEQLVCTLPAGVGFDQAVVVSNTLLFSAPVRLLSYAPPNITGLTGCGMSQPTMALVGCERGGGQLISISGKNFGSSKAQVFVGSKECQNVTHDRAKPDFFLTCVLPPGTGEGLLVLVVQHNGVVNTIANSPTLSYQQCERGTYLQNFNCPQCAPGYFGISFGATSCSPCAAGTYNNDSGLTLCHECSTGFYQSFPGKRECLPCPIGTFLDVAGQQACVPCDIGKYANSTGSRVCTLCPSGRYASTERNHECLPCAPGSIAPTSGAVACDLCPPGTFSNQSSNQSTIECQACDVGFYQSSFGQTACIPCDIGTSQSAIGQLTCQACAIGRFVNETQATACIPCPPGRYQANEGSTDCVDCDPKYYNPSVGQSYCEETDRGSFSNVSGLTDAYPCPAGYYQDQKAQEVCLPCPAGKAAPYTLTAECDVCPPGTFSSGEANQNCTVCPPGTKQGIVGSQSCDPCASGTISSEDRINCVLCPEENIAPVPALGCQPCRGGQIANKDRTQCQCPIGQYGVTKVTLNTTVVECLPCPKGAKCSTLGVTLDTLETKPGWWRASVNSTVYFKCLSASQCLGGHNSTCAAHRVGPICSLCEEGYSSSSFTSTSGCRACGGTGQSVGITIVFVIVVILGLTLMYWIVLRSDGPKSLIYEPGAIEHFEATGSRTRSRGGSTSITSAPSVLGQAVSLPQPEARVRALEGHRAPNSELHFVGHELVMENGQIAPAENLTPEARSKANITSSLKITVSFLQIVTSLNAVTNVAWPSVYYDFSSIFGFVNLDFIPWQSVSCLVTLDYYQQLLVICITPLVVFFVLGLFFLLPSYILDRMDMTDLDIYRARRERRRRQFFNLIFFSCFLVYPKLCQTVTTYFLCTHVNGVDYLVNDFRVICFDDRWFRYVGFDIVFLILYPIGIPAMFFVMLWTKRNQLYNDPLVAQSLGFLFRAYRQGVWWFEMLDMTNKLLLTSIIRFAKPGWQLAWALGVNGGYTVLILYIEPYLRRSEDRLHLLAQIEIMLFILAGWILQKTNTGLDTVTDVLLGILFITLLVLILAFFIMLSFRYLKTIFFRHKRQKAIELAIREQSGFGENNEGGIEVEMMTSKLERSESTPPTYSPPAAGKSLVSPSPPPDPFNVGYGYGDPVSQTRSLSKSRLTQPGETRDELQDLDDGRPI